jgi:chemotaxis protein MotB
VRKHEEEHENHERWLVSYADFITLLFAFFTVLYATSQKDVAKAKEFETSVRKAFRVFLDFGGQEGGERAMDQDKNPIPPPIDHYPPQGGGPAELEDTVKRLLDKVLSKEQQQESISEVRHDAVGVEISLAASAIFPSGSDAFTEKGIEIINKVGSILKASGKKLIIQGHTDDQPISNSQFASNWELSSARATKIIRYLIRKHKIPKDKLIAVAYADQKPIADNSTEEGRAKNRRIEILMVTGQSPL